MARLARRNTFITKKGKRLLRGRRFDVRRRGIRAADDMLDVERVWANGVWLNVPESRIYRALQKMKEPAIPMFQIGRPNTLGAAQVDFYLPRVGIALEVDGVFHRQTEGKAKDFWRNVVRERAGMHVVRISAEDAMRRDLVRILKELIGYGWSGSIRTSVGM